VCKPLSPVRDNVQAFKSDDDKVNRLVQENEEAIKREQLLDAAEDQRKARKLEQMRHARQQHRASTQANIDESY